MKKILALFLWFLFLFPTGVSAFMFGIEDFTLANNISAYEFGRENIANDTTNPDNQGSYLATGYKENSMNISDQDILDLLSFAGFGSDITIQYLGKDETGNIMVPLSQSGDGGLVSGTWSYTPTGNNPDSIDLLLVKGSTSFSAHKYDPAANWGEWNVGYLDETGKNELFPPTLSHISVYLSDLPPDNQPVPEPGTIMLIGIGIAGIAGFNRKKFKK